jgi:hypothetical protein
MLSTNSKYYVLLALAFVEYFLFAHGRDLCGIYFAPLLLAIVGGLIGGIASGVATQPAGKPIFVATRSIQDYWPVMLVLGGGLLMILKAATIFNARPIDHNDSDILAQVLQASQWLLRGEYPYQTVVLPTYAMNNTYLPMMWMPFTMSFIFDFDPRWLPLMVWIVVLSIFCYRLLVRDTGTKYIGIVSIGLVFMWIYAYMSVYTYDYRVSIELLPASYYLLLVLMLIEGSWLGIGLAMGACLLSRFSIVLFIPFLLWYVHHRWGWQTLWKSCLACMAVILVLFILPFVSKDPSLPSKIVANYNSGAANEWRTQSWQAPHEEPHQLSRGLGAALIVKKLYEYDIKEGVKHLRQAGLALSILAGVIMIYLYRRNYAWIDQDWFLLGSIKIYFTIFYTLILIPYPYLFVLPLMSTAMIVIYGARQPSVA